MNNIFKGELQLVYILLILNVIADVAVYVFKPIGVIRGVINLIFIIFFLLKRYPGSPLFQFLMAFLTYLFILTFFSSDFTNSLLEYLKWFISFMMIPIGYTYFRNITDLRKLTHLLIICAIIINVNLIIAQITNTGFSAYEEDSFYLGGAGVGITNILSIFLITLPVFLHLRIKKKLNIKIILVSFLATLSLIFILIAMKRAAIVGLGIGILVFILYSPNRFGIIKLLSFSVIIIALTLPLYENIVIDRYNARTTDMNQIENESRIHDIIFVKKEIQNGTIVSFFFGTELFNSKQFYGPKYYGRHRMIHGDFTNYLYGSGIIGLLLYIFIYLNLYHRFRGYYVKVRSNKTAKILYTSFIGVLFCFLIISITGSGTIGERSVTFIFLGASLRTMRNIYINELVKGNLPGYKNPR